MRARRTIVATILGVLLPLAAAASPYNYQHFYNGTPYSGTREVAFFTGQGLVSPSCGYQVTVRPWDRQFVLETRNAPAAAWWANNVGSTPGFGYVSMTTDGVLRYYNWAEQVLWQSSPSTAQDSIGLWDDGVLNVYRWGGYADWATPSRGQSSATCPGSYEAYPTRTFVFRNTDCPGYDYTGFYISAAYPSWCGYFCAEDNLNYGVGTCDGYTYVPPGVQGTNAVCWLKRDLPLPVQPNGSYDASGYSPPSNAVSSQGMVCGWVN